MSRVIFSYRVKSDTGFAPCIDNGLFSLACCKGGQIRNGKNILTGVRYHIGKHWFQHPEDEIYVLGIHKNKLLYYAKTTKGFDSSSGGCPSPIMPDGTLLSLPIPDEYAPAVVQNPEKLLKFNDLVYKGHTYTQLLAGLRQTKTYNVCHLDPDLRMDVRSTPVNGWKAAFGQTESALGVLRNAKVQIGDLFLFFGLFRKAEYYKDTMRFVRGAKKIQIIYGYLEIGEILDKPEQIEKFYWHPHATKGLYEEEKNAIFLPGKHLSLCPSLPGYGVLDYREDRILTMQGENTATWKPHSFYMPNSINDDRKNSAKKGSKGLYYAGQWQELVLKPNDDANDWALKMITEASL